MRCLLNTIIPKTIFNINSIGTALSSSLLEYKTIKEDFPNLIDGIVTTGDTNSVLLNTLSLENCLSTLNKEIKEYAYSVFLKYPLEEYLDTDTYLEQINDEYFLTLDSEKFDGTYLHLISKHEEGGIAFSLQLHSNLAKNTLLLSSVSNNININNLYGTSSNTEYIKSLLADLRSQQLTNLENLVELLDNPISAANKFDREFERLNPELQTIIFQSFKDMLDDKKNNRIIPETILKDVTPEKEHQITLYELKIRDPIAKRIYFSIIEGKYYLASIEDKPLKDRKTTQQTTHIKSAISKIKELRATTS